jgi:predicted ATPase/class 3 adenylate cyclase
VVPGDPSSNIDVTAPLGSRRATSVGTVSRWFVFTDIEGSTARWEHFPDSMSAALARHDETLVGVFEDFGGQIVKHTGDGLLVAFEEPAVAVRAAVEGQRRLGRHSFSEVDGLGVRMGIHGGEVMPRGGDFFGTVLNRVARVMDAGHGGQVLASREVVDLTVGSLTPDGISFASLGLHRLKGVAVPMELASVEVADLQVIDRPLRTQNATSGNLRAPSGALIGRNSEVEAVGAAVSADPLVTLVGPGGVGKTVLALHVAERSRHLFPDGAWFVDLAAVSDPEWVIDVVAGVLGIERREPHSLLETLREAMAHRSALVVLDNCEHVRSAAARVAGALSQGRTTRVLSTSRQSLGVTGERVVRVEPLTTGVAADRSSPGAAQALFIERATAAGAVVDTVADAEAIFAICEELDGLPLAIELAAARVGVLTVADVAARLNQRLRLLRSPDADLSRHRTLEATLDWSHQLLAPPEQRMLSILGGFEGGFDLEAVQAVSGLDEFETLDLIDDLVAKSLVEPPSRSSTLRRFRTLQTVHEFAAARLAASTERDTVAAAHADHYASMVERANRERSAEASWLPRLHGELANLRSAFGQLLLHDPRRAARLALSLWPLWTSRGLLDEGARWLGEAIAAVDPNDPIAEQLVDDLASMNWSRGSTREAARACAEAIARAEASGVAPRPTLLVRMAAISASERRTVEALALIDRAASLHREDPSSNDKVELCSAMSAVLALCGDHHRAIAFADEGLVVARELGHTRLSSALSNAATAYLESEPDRARLVAIEALELASEIGSRYGQGNALFMLGLAERVRGDKVAALAAFVDALAALRDSGQRTAMASCLDQLASALRPQLASASVAMSAASAAQRALAEGDPEIIVVRRERARVRLVVGDHDESAFSSAWEFGGALTLDEVAIEAALAVEMFEL